MTQTVPLSLTPGVALGLVHDDVGKNKSEKEWPANVQDVPIPVWDTGVFINELESLDMLPARMSLTDAEQEISKGNPEALLAKAQRQAPPRIEEGTYRGTQLALTKIYDLIEKKYSSYMDTANFEPTVPSRLPLSKKKQFYAFTIPDPIGKKDGDSYPPHLNLAANKPLVEQGENQRASLTPADLFNKLRLAQLTSLLPALIPKSIFAEVGAKAAQGVAALILGGMGTPDSGTKISDIEQFNNDQRDRRFRNDIFNLPNIGDLPDWYTDARFAQQHFTGTNPTTIEVASEEWIKHFIGAATEEDQDMRNKIMDIADTNKESLYVQDYSYFRRYAGMTDDEPIECEFIEHYKDDNGDNQERISKRYGTAAVCLFHLNDDGRLEPLAIVIDWCGSAEKSVTIYNKQLNKSDQSTDWAWRYAKTCVQSSDWVRHEVTCHLTLTHMVEEATIVAAQRCFENDHPVLKLLFPHWQKTLALNAAARDTLVPHVIMDLTGFTKNQCLQFIQSEYYNFDFQKRYVPSDLRSRGFPPEELNTRKYHNYAYARCIHSMWYKIRSYVAEMLAISYNGGEADAKVAGDEYIKDWYQTMQRNPEEAGAGIKTFPTITTLEGLIDAVTMCIHLASPQHTAVNYLQNYYQSFVINKPPCFYTPPPTSLPALRAFNQDTLVATLPMNHPQEWLLSSHIPYLLSFKPGDKESLIIYAASKYHVYKRKEAPDDIKVRDAAARFYSALAETETEFKRYGQDTDDAVDILYDVLSPSWNAVSILI